MIHIYRIERPGAIGNTMGLWRAQPGEVTLRLRLYLDACCLNRLTDDQSQARIRDEAEAVEAIFRMVRTGKATWVSSTALEIEINRNPDADRRHDVAALLALANEVVVP